MAEKDAPGKARQTVSMVLACIGTVWLVLAFLVGVVEIAAFYPGYYRREYEKNDAAQYVGVDRETLDGATVILLEYLQGKRDSLDYRARIDGEDREYYNTREKLHMADVRTLNENAVRFMQAGFVCGGGMLSAALVMGRKRYEICGACFWSILGVLAAFACIGLWAAADFTNFWVSFHHVFFTNDLWLFDPKYSLLIRMFEEQFFFDLVAQILAWFLSVTVLAAAVTGVLYRKGRNGAGLAHEYSRN